MSTDPKRIVHDSAVQKYLTVKAVAEFFGVSDMSIRRAIDSGEIKAIRLGTAFRVPVDELRRIETENVVEPGSLGHTEYMAGRTEARRRGRAA